MNEKSIFLIAIVISLFISFADEVKADLIVPYEQSVQPYYIQRYNQPTIPFMPPPQPDYNQLQRQQQQFERQMYQQYRLDQQNNRFNPAFNHNSGDGQ